MAEDGPDLEAGRLLFARDVVFVRGVTKLGDLPAGALPEIAFAGRSNVGKSSLINALVNRKGLARASNEPGRTRELNFFRLADAVMLVDLPGYGYARAPKTEIARWSTLTRDYLRGRACLRRVVLLVDARHGLKPADREVMDLLAEAAVLHQIVLTKVDKVPLATLQKRFAETTAAIARAAAAHRRVLATSAANGAGIPELRAELAAAASP